MLMAGPAELFARSRALGAIDTPEKLVALAVATAAKHGHTPVEDPRTIEAYLNYGRWVADCPRCLSGIVIHPEWSIAACLGARCYRVYRSIAVPEAWRDFEKVVSARDLIHQHWLTAAQRTKTQGFGADLPAETLADLIRENVDHGVRVPFGELESVLTDDTERK